MSGNIQRLIDLLVRLRDRKNGCPWDIKQTHDSLASGTLEEVYELVDAIERHDTPAIKDELGDVLLHVVFHARIAEENGQYDLDAVAGHVTDKMIERHPHVFGEREVNTAADVVTNWESDKEAKRKAAAENEGRVLSVLDSLTAGLPAATRAVKLQKRAARVGFDWAQSRDVLAKIREEIAELEAEIDAGSAKDFLEDELGDVFFAVTNLARKLDIDPETALRRTNRKFERRFRGIEQALAAQGKKIEDASLEEMEVIWNSIKAQEKLDAPKAR